MELTDKLKVQIDEMSIEQLLCGVRFSPVGDPMFQGETGEYWLKRLNEKRAADPTAYTIASKAVGWR